MITLLDNPARVDHQDDVALADRAQAVGNGDAGAAMEERGQSGLDRSFGPGIDAAGGLVQDQNAGIGQDRAGEGE